MIWKHYLTDDENCQADWRDLQFPLEEYDEILGKIFDRDYWIAVYTYDTDNNGTIFKYKPLRTRITNIEKNKFGEYICYTTTGHEAVIHNLWVSEEDCLKDCSVLNKIKEDRALDNQK